MKRDDSRVCAAPTGCKEIAPLITVAQAIRASGLTRHTIRLLVEKGELTTIQLPTGRKLLKRTDLESLRIQKTLGSSHG